VGGGEYICITSRHHDGFSMFDTKQSDFNIVKATPFKRDVIKELADECHKQGIKLHFYYSHLDWSRDDYFPLGRTGRGTGRTTQGKWETYYQFMNNQLTELLTNYGPIGAIWFDGWWDHDQDPGFDWQLPEQYAMIHRLQPSCLIGNNHHETPFAGEDIQIFERDLPGENKAGYSGQDVSRLPLETCETMNGMWGYRITDQNYKSTETLVQYLVKAAGKNANLLMNIGPQPNGELPQVSIERLKEIGAWMEVYGESIYGTRGGFIEPRNWGVTTEKGNKLYVHILDLEDKGLFLPITDKKVKQARCFKDQSAIKFKQDKSGVVLELPEVPTDIDYVVELTF
jgi:alpha-L-fucosidase